MNYPNRVIERGESSKTVVKAVQNQLNMKGCGPIEVDGDFGNNTYRAVKLFQSRHLDSKGNPLVIDGKIGPITWDILFAADRTPTAASAPTMLLKKVLEIANSQIGVVEQPAHSNRGPEVDLYLKAVGLNPKSGNYPWCAAFVYWCFEQAAKELGKTNPLVKTAGVLDHWNRTKGIKISTSVALSDLSKIQPGSIFIMDFGKGQGHTGIVESVGNGYITTIEGNTNNDNSREGYGVFRLSTRKVNSIKKGFIYYS
ncbi:CHAP domain-containing protein [Flavobacterium sp. CYK-4]|uniref:CHAP domain-containing protein n=1 Tax=Flavobacterium lotistagni TaxID=2709660 RepID=UPI00140AAA6D|nr:CHAP domain-containing protein [Flavobacterium lotistagni]NHM08191.1 CHAP domain-containing protein [Flavobacterium lotistagni]